MRGQLSMLDELIPVTHCTPDECPACHPWESVRGKARCEKFGAYPDGRWFSVGLGARCCSRGGPPADESEDS